MVCEDLLKGGKAGAKGIHCGEATCRHTVKELAEEQEPTEGGVQAAELKTHTVTLRSV